MGAEIGAAIATAAGLAEGTAAFAAVVTATTIVVNTGIAYGLNAALAANKEPNPRDAELGSRGGTKPHKIILGRALVYGDVVNEYSFHSVGSGKANQYARQIVLAGHEITEIEKIRIDGEFVSWAKVFGDAWSNGSQGRILSAPYANVNYSSRGTAMQSVLHFSHNLGKTDQVADAMLRALMPEKWTSNHRLRGLPYAAFLLKSDRNVFESPNIEPAFVVKGMPVYDPRDPAQDSVDPETWTWSDNSILLAAHFQRTRYGPRQNAVLGLPGQVSEPRRTDWEQVKDGADICDELVDTPDQYLSAPVKERRYRAWGIAVSDADPYQTIGKIMSSCAGWYAHQSGVFRCWPGAYYTPVQGFKFEEEDFTSGVSLQFRKSKADRFGGVRGNFYSEADGWRKVAYAEQVLPGLIGDVDMLDFDQDFTPSPYQAQRVGMIEIKRRDQGLTFSAQTNYKGVLVGAGDTPMISYPDEDLQDASFWITDWGHSEDKDNVPALGFTADLHTEAMFAEEPLTPYQPSTPVGGGGVLVPQGPRNLLSENAFIGLGDVSN